MHGQADVAPRAPELAGRPDFTLGSAIISPSTRTIRGPGGEAAVEPRVMQVLLALADADGRVVSRDALFQRCWGNVYVGDDSLNRAIAEVRRAARTAAASSFAIETIPRTGYRLTADGSGDAPSAAEALKQPAGGLSRRAVIGAGVAGVAATAGGAVVWRWARPDPTDVQVRALIAQSEQAARRGLPDSDSQGAGFLEEATALQPDNAEAWGKLALARAAIAEYAPPGQVAAAVAGVQDAASRAIALQPRQVDAHAALAILTPVFGDWLAAERRFDAVLAIDPEHLPTRDARDFMLTGVGRTQESSLDRLVIAAREPLHAIHQFKLIYAYWLLDRIGDADRVADRALQLWPKHPGVWFGRLWTLAFTGRVPRALAHVEDAAGRPDLPPWIVETLRSAMAALDSRRPADVALAADRVVDDVTRGPSESIAAVLILAGLGEIDRAFEVAEAYLLEQGRLMARVRWREGDVSVNDQRRRKTHMLFVPATAPMRSDPRFMPLMQSLELTDYWEQAGVTPDFLRTP